MDALAFSLKRDRLAQRHAELSRLLKDPTRANITMVLNELRRLAQG